MTDRPQNDELDRYLDGDMSPAERDAFESRRRSEPDLDAEVRHQRAIDARLRAAFTPPADAASARELLARAEADQRPSGRWNNRRRLLVAAAAVLALGAAAWHFTGPDSAPSAAIARLEAGPLYDDILGSPEGAPGCALPNRLADVVRSECQGSLSCGEPSAEFRVAAAPCSSWPSATILFGRQEDQLVVLVIDGADRDPAPLGAAGLNVHRRVVGEFVLYELSRNPRPLLLDGFALGS